MQEIKCPNCGTVFQVDESGYAQILQQVRDKEFEKELERRERELAEKRESELKLVRMEQEKSYDQALSKKDSEIAGRDEQIAELKGLLEKAGTELKALQDKAGMELKAQQDKAEMEKKLAVSEAVQAKERELSEKGTEIAKLKGDLELQKKESALRESSLDEKHKGELKLRDEEIERLKDFKARQSTKMIGESLEQHCLTQFNQIRMTAFPNAYFEKDNDARTGSKGDFIFREAADGTEFISIMFEMKNEMDTTASKHRNEDFFRELDKDRREKNCEYAVLVSLLESDSELYNSGIVDVSYRYPKMYVIRPQFFIPMITLLRNAALNSLKYQRELQIVRDQQLDLRNFESEMAAFKEGFARNYDIASRKFKTAIEEIDKTIDHLQKTKDALLSSENQLRLANNKAEDLSIKKLTKNAPSVRAMFEEVKRESDKPDGEWDG